MFVHPNSNEQRYSPFPPNFYRFVQQPQPQFYPYQQQPLYNAASFMLPPPLPPFLHQTYPQYRQYNIPTYNHYQEQQQQPRMTYYADEHDDYEPQNAPVFIPDQQQDFATQFPPLQLPRRIRSSKQNHAAFVKRETRKVLLVRVACAVILQLFEKYEPEGFNRLATFIKSQWPNSLHFLNNN